MTAKLVSELAEKIQQKIAAGEFPPGHRLRQELLAKEFDVSRTPIREALRQLETKGLVSQSHRKSAVVSAPSLRDVKETYQVRAELEGLAAELAATWITDAQLALMRETHARFAEAIETLARHSAKAQRDKAARVTKQMSAAAEAWTRTNAAFHRIIHDACDNRRLSATIHDLNQGQIRSIMLATILGMDAHRLRLTLTHHEKILDRLTARDVKGAREAVVTHIQESGEFVVRWLERNYPGPDGKVRAAKPDADGSIRPWWTAADD